MPYAGAKSDGHLMSHAKSKSNTPQQHAFIACNVIAAAAKKKKDSNVYSRSSTAELQLPKVNDSINQDMRMNDDE